MCLKYCKYTLTTLLLFLFIVVNAQDLVINEFMASNDSLSGIVDEFGETDDWVELHNRTNSAVDISGYHLSDDYGTLDKWTFPNGIIIPANGYLIVWTDKDDIQGDLHTSWKLNITGERIALTSDMGVVLDSITYGQQETNVSMARIPNGTGPFIQQAPTFNASNGPTSIENFDLTEYLNVYPTLVSDELFIENSLDNNEDATFQIYTFNGQKVYARNEVMTPFDKDILYVSNLVKGTYTLVIQLKNGGTKAFYFQKI